MFAQFWRKLSVLPRVNECSPQLLANLPSYGHITGSVKPPAYRYRSNKTREVRVSRNSSQRSFRRRRRATRSPDRKSKSVILRLFTHQSRCPSVHMKFSVCRRSIRRLAASHFTSVYAVVASNGNKPPQFNAIMFCNR